MKNLSRCIPLGSLVLFGCLTEADDTLPLAGNQRSLTDRPPLQEGTAEVEPVPPQDGQPQQPLLPATQGEPASPKEGLLPARENPSEDSLIPKEANTDQPPPPNGNIQEKSQDCSLLSGRKNSPSINIEDSITVRSSTTPRYPDNKILIEIVRPSPQEGNVALYNFSCPPSDEFQYNLPSDIGPVYAIYFLDENGGGPSQQEILGRSPLIDPKIEESLSFSVKLEKNADLSPLTLTFEPKAKKREYELPNPIAEPDANLPPPLAEPEANLPPPLAEPEANLPPPRKRSDTP